MLPGEIAGAANEATTGSRWQLGDHDAAAEVDAGSLQNALS